LRYGLISDIHSNLEALNAVLDALKNEAIDEYVCLGDIVGYAASPNECIQVVRELSNGSVLGNHDSAALGLTSIDEFNPLAKKAIAWTSKELSSKNKKYLESLKVDLELKGGLAVHSSPSDPQMWRYVFTTEDARAEFQHFTQRICFIGHSHQPLTFVNSKERAIVDPRPVLEVEKGNRYIVNIGSVGQPRDFDPRASYAVYDATRNTVQIKRVEYDTASARRRIIEAGLPRYLGDRLLAGR
jgi:diadenosine tetraphosphatase ApaH/serine/threonine PP2A family protein phosphatase